jgi:hypothetical protein
MAGTVQLCLEAAAQHAISWESGTRFLRFSCFIKLLNLSPSGLHNF